MNPLESALAYLQKIFEPKTIHSFRKPGHEQPAQDPMAAQAQQLAQATPVQTAQPSATPHPLAAGIPQPDPTMSPYAVGQNITPEEVERKLRAGFQEYSKGKGVPMEEHIPQLVEGATKYPGLQKNPFLTAAVSINETSGGRGWQENKNPISWGARQKDVYRPESIQQALEDMMSAVGSDRKGETGYDEQTAKSRQRTAGYYKPFRESNNLQDFSFQYESPKNNAKYYEDLIKMIQMFERQ